MKEERQGAKVMARIINDNDILAPWRSLQGKWDRTGKDGLFPATLAALLLAMGIH